MIEAEDVKAFTSAEEVNTDSVIHPAEVKVEEDVQPEPPLYLPTALALCTAYRIYQMSIWQTYLTADTLQLTIVTMSLTPIVVLRITQSIHPEFVWAYTCFAVAMQLNEKGSLCISTLILILLELAACFMVPVGLLKRYCETLKRLQLLIVLGFWLAMVVTAVFAPDDFSFMSLDQAMKSCGVKASCWLDDDAKLKAFAREFVGHFLLQLFAFFTLSRTVTVMKIDSDKKWGGMAKYLIVWASIVGSSSILMTGQVPYLVDREK